MVHRVGGRRPLRPRDGGGGEDGGGQGDQGADGPDEEKGDDDSPLGGLGPEGIDDGPPPLESDGEHGEYTGRHLTPRSVRIFLPSHSPWTER